MSYSSVLTSLTSSGILGIFMKMSIIVLMSLFYSSTLLAYETSLLRSCCFLMASRLPRLSLNSLYLRKKEGNGSKIYVALDESRAFAATDKSKATSWGNCIISASTPPVRLSSKVNSQDYLKQALGLIEG
jgi:hypothetical protein